MSNQKSTQAANDRSNGMNPNNAQGQANTANNQRQVQQNAAAAKQSGQKK